MAGTRSNIVYDDEMTIRPGESLPAMASYTVPAGVSTATIQGIPKISIYPIVDERPIVPVLGLALTGYNAANVDAFDTTALAAVSFTKQIDNTSGLFVPGDYLAVMVVTVLRSDGKTETRAYNLLITSVAMGAG